MDVEELRARHAHQKEAVAASTLRVKEDMGIVHIYSLLCHADKTQRAANKNTEHPIPTCTHLLAEHHDTRANDKPVHIEELRARHAHHEEAVEVEEARRVGARQAADVVLGVEVRRLEQRARNRQDVLTGVLHAAYRIILESLLRVLFLE